MAKSVLVGLDSRFRGSDEVCKLSGFGSAVEEEDGVEYFDDEMDLVEGLRHAAPEVLTMATFSAPSDMWAFGCLMFEVFSCGYVPCTRLQRRIPFDQDTEFVQEVSR